MRLAPAQATRAFARYQDRAARPRWRTETAIPAPKRITTSTAPAPADAWRHWKSSVEIAPVGTGGTEKYTPGPRASPRSSGRVEGMPIERVTARSNASGTAVVATTD